MRKARHARQSPATLITSPKALRALVTRMSACRRIALDTEFMQGEVYKPVLALVQIGLEDQSAHLIDPVALPDLRSLNAILSNENIVKVLHDPSQDLGILNATTGATFKNVFDTRLAGQLLSLGRQGSLSEYVRWLTGEDLDKGPQRSDWLQRPLSRSQLYYAGNDVTHLLPMHEQMLKRAREMGRTTWIVEDLLRYEDSASYEMDVDPVARAFRIGGANALKARNLSVLAEIALWREEMAEKLDIPTRHLLSPGKMLHVARRAPKTPAAVRAVFPEISPFAKHIAERVKAGLTRKNAIEVPLPPKPHRLTKLQKKCCRQLRNAVLAKATELDVPAMHLARRPELEKLARHAFDPDIPCLRGWRLDVIGRQLKQVAGGYDQAPIGAP